jgi:8-oxo-dGTP pyrophosphatase MutT (NUDIX family)
MMREVITAGGIIVENSKILLIRHKSGGFAFAKGHIEEGESLEETAIREVGEETTYLGKIVNYLGYIERLSTEKTGEQVKKRVELFKMVRLTSLENVPEEIPEWVNTNQAIKDMQFPEEADFLKLHRFDLS